MSTPATVAVSGVALEMTERGQGRPLLFLHPGHPSGRLAPTSPVLDHLAKHARVLAPTHPGFGSVPAPRELTTIDDLAYLYLDLLDTLKLDGVVVVGVQLGGWIAAEMAVKSTARISKLVLADAVGIKVGDRETRDIADIYAVTDKTLAELVYADPARMAVDTKTLPQEELVFVARSRESTGRYAWSPYMHNPVLRRWLHRIDRPTHIVWGEADRLVSEDCKRAWAARIPGAVVTRIAGVGHFPDVENPIEAAALIADFAKKHV